LGFGLKHRGHRGHREERKEVKPQSSQRTRSEEEKRCELNNPTLLFSSSALSATSAVKTLLFSVLSVLSVFLSEHPGPNEIPPGLAF
jgi:hypothetical protein